MEIARYDPRALSLFDHNVTGSRCLYTNRGQVWVPAALAFVENVIYQHSHPGFGADVAVCSNGQISTSSFFRVAVSAALSSRDFPFDQQVVYVNFANLLGGAT